MMRSIWSCGHKWNAKCTLKWSANAVDNAATLRMDRSQAHLPTRNRVVNAGRTRLNVEISAAATQKHAIIAI